LKTLPESLLRLERDISVSHVTTSGSGFLCRVMQKTSAKTLCESIAQRHELETTMERWLWAWRNEKRVIYDAEKIKSSFFCATFVLVLRSVFKVHGSGDYAAPLSASGNKGELFAFEAEQRSLLNSRSWFVKLKWLAPAWTVNEGTVAHQLLLAFTTRARFIIPFKKAWWLCGMQMLRGQPRQFMRVALKYWTQALYQSSWWIRGRKQPNEIPADYRCKQI